jgi:RNA polymerase sigma-70 factor (ECF subfamily)
VQEVNDTRQSQASTGLVDGYGSHCEELVRFASVLVGPDDAHDVVSSAMLRLLDGKPHQVTRPKAYLYQAVANQARNHKRRESRRRRRERLAADWDGQVTTPEPYPEVRKAIQALSVRQRAVIYLTYWADLTESDIAEHLGIRPGTVRRHLARARQHLRRALDDHEE